MSNIISWLTVDNGVNEIMVNDSLKHTLKRTKKIKRRTRALNVELKKFSTLKCYSEYVTIKTDILRNISDNEDTDDEPFARSAIALGNSRVDNATLQCDRSNEQNNLLECMYEEESKEQRSKSNEGLREKTHPIITCTEIVMSKYTIIRDNEDKYRKLSECQPDQDSPDSKGTNDGSDRLSPNARQTDRLGDIDRSNGNSTNDASHCIDDETLPTTDNRPSGQRIFNKESSSSQVISDPSDCDERNSSNDNFGNACKFGGTRGDNYLSSVSRPSQASDGDSVLNCARKNDSDVLHERSIKKSIKSQIAEQEFVESNNETMIMGDKIKSVENSLTNEVPSDVESLRYVLQNLCSTGKKNSAEYSSADEIEHSTSKTSSSTTQYPMKILPRPMGLQEFVDRQRLIPTYEISNISIDDIESASKLDGNEEIWLMEIPRTIAKDSQLCGKRILLKGRKMKIGDVSYKTIIRHDKSVSCILSVGKARAQFKTVNLRPVGSIVVRQESYETDNTPPTSSLTSLCESLVVQSDTTGRNGSLVPFPNNLKTRNPLAVSNVYN